MWFPTELWRIIKNFMLGKKYWMIKYKTIINDIPKKYCVCPIILTSATKSIRFKKKLERVRSEDRITIVYSIYDP